MLARPLKEDGIDRIHLQDRIFPFDETIKRSASRFRNVKEDNRLVSPLFALTDCLVRNG